MVGRLTGSYRSIGATSLSHSLTRSQNVQWPVIANYSRGSGRKSSLLAQSGDVFGRRTAEEAAVFSAELRSAEIAYALTRSTRVRHGRHHETPRLLQAQHLLIVQWAHRSDGLKVLVERGNTHVHQFGQVFDLHGLREVSPQPGNRLRNAVHAGLRKAHLSDANTNRAAQQPDQNLIHHKRGEQLGVPGMRKTLH